MSRFEPGDQFGDYRIHAFVGRGGMGEVYDAEHREQGRRVALKALHRRLRRAGDRNRFLAEGRLAAAVSHPHCVYVFETDEIGGIPVIAMEFVAGGTLKDRVVTGGPMPPTEAVEAILQVVDGLEAAHAAGVLHRDVKPSNCFVATDGLVKVGDFGLSLSVAGAGDGVAARRAGFEGTPQFAAPEQFDGAVQDVRADIYAAGATLYFLLTGAPPFDGHDLEELLARIRTEPASLPPNRSSPLPPELVAVVCQCLAKDPASRPGSYAELRLALAPFASSATRPAPFGLRVAAATYDVIVIGFLMGVLVAMLVIAHVIRGEASVALLSVVGAVVYWGALEGLAGAGYGKQRCGLHVVDACGRPPGLSRAVLRSFLCALPIALPLAVGATVGGLVGRSLLSALVLSAAALGCAALVIPLCRRGGAPLQDWLTGTRVVQRTERLPATVRPPVASAPSVATPEWCGPYRVDADLGETDHGRLQRGWDPQLQRPVWIHRVPADTGAVPGVVRNVSRAARLHWLDGHRGPGGGWDAYDALEGQPLLSMSGSQPWSAVSMWLADLAHELEAAVADGSMDTVDLTRVWITAHGRGKLLPFSAPGLSTRLAPSRLDAASGQQALHACAIAALGTPTPPLPLSVSMWLRALTQGTFASLGHAAVTLDGLRDTPERVTPTVRGMTLALGVVTYLSTSVDVSRLIAEAASQTTGWGPLAMQWLPEPVYGRIGCALLGLLSACALRSGVWLRAFGVAVVTSDGVEVSRVRAGWRAVAAWGWVPLHVLAATIGHGQGGVALLTVAGLAYAAFSPPRGWQDRFAGTYLVPR
ncbi:MAG: protein kinase [Vicinamibacterales bacterium]